MATKTEDRTVENEEINRIVFDYNGTTYTMEFDRETASQTEKMFDISITDVRDAKMSAFEGLFYGSFLKHHPNIKQHTVETFIKLLPNKAELLKNLTIMYSECVNSLLAEPDEGEALSWTAM